MHCQIVPVTYKTSFRWKWRYVGEDGIVAAESQETYALYYECVCAARANGYRPVLRVA